MSVATFVLSTGRCGTQWLARALAACYPDRLAVEHEPLHARYRPREALRHAATPLAAAPLPPAVADHAAAIDARLAAHDYVECGHPAWSTIPRLAERFRGRVRIVHLVRHPVPTSLSWLTHQAFAPPLLPHLAEKILLSPFDDGVRFPDYQARWPDLSPFEKCLYYWTEVNAFGLEWASRLDAPWLRLRMEDLFHADGLARLLDFLGLPPRDAMDRWRDAVVDDQHAVLAAMHDWQRIHAHPHAIAVAQALGYAVDAVDPPAMARRYLGAG